MTALATLNPVPQYFDLDGTPLSAGRLYFGTVNGNPITAPVTVYWDAAMTQPAAQPIRTLNGYPVRAGAAAMVYVDGDYSMLVQDSTGRQVLYARNSADFGNAATLSARLVAFIASLASSLGSTLVGFLQAGAGAVLRTMQAKARDIINVRDYGADPAATPAVNRAAVQAAITYGRTLGRFFKVEISDDLQIDAPVYIGRKMAFVGPGRLVQVTDNVPIVVANLDALTAFWSIDGVDLRYLNAQPATNTAASALVLGSGVICYAYRVSNSNIQYGCNGVDAPSVSGTFNFLAKFSNVVIEQCSGIGFDWQNDASGATTNLILDNVWANNIKGSEIAGARGFRMRNVNPLVVRNMACDDLLGQPYEIVNCFGSIDAATAESCEISASSGLPSFMLISGGSISIGSWNMVLNSITISGTAGAVGLRVSDGAVVEVDRLIDNQQTFTSTSSDTYYAAQATTNAGRLTVDSYAYTASGSPVPSGSFSDLNSPPKIRVWDGDERHARQGGRSTVYGTAAPTSGTWAVGDRVRSTNPTLAAPVAEWCCIVAGTPGTWVACSWIIGRNNSASRPILIASDAGVQYMDTTLAAGGKLITWAGSTWVDASGAAGV